MSKHQSDRFYVESRQNDKIVFWNGGFSFTKEFPDAWLFDRLSEAQECARKIEARWPGCVALVQTHQTED